MEITFEKGTPTKPSLTCQTLTVGSRASAKQRHYMNTWPDSSNDRAQKDHWRRHSSVCRRAIQFPFCALSFGFFVLCLTAALPCLADEAPDITAHPQSQALIASEDAQFSVTASGTEPLAYQWRFNHTDIGGATASAYSINFVQSFDAGDYEVVVTNATGVVQAQ